MKQQHYTFISVWHLDAPLKSVWDHIVHIEEWPQWWKGVHDTKITNNTGHAEEGGVGSTIDSTWKSWLPYTIHFTLTITEMSSECSRLIATAQGDLNGTGTWEFSEANGQTIAKYTWEVSTAKWWMNLIAPLARPLFAHAHDTIMHWGETGLQNLLTQESDHPGVQ